MNNPLTVIRDIEERSCNAWPSLQTVCLDGWLLRFAGGYTRRTNSVHPLYPSRQQCDLSAKIAYCETLYAQTCKQDVVFKMTAAAEPEQLDGLLAERGYSHVSDTSVQTLDLAGHAAPDLAGRQLIVSPTPSEPWLAACYDLSNLPDAHRPVLRQILDRIVVPATAFALLKEGDEPVAVGIAVAERGYVGLFDINTAPQWRRRGIGTQLVSSLLSWGKDQGADRAYLQVVKTNEAALRLYAKLGFAEAYTYWYRVKQRKTI